MTRTFGACPRRVAGVAAIACILGLAASASGEDAGDLPDLAVVFVSRTPRFPAYETVLRDGLPRLCAPGTAGTDKEELLQPAEAARVRRAPATNEFVEYTALVVNLGRAPAGPFEVAWILDGKAVKSASHGGLAAGPAGFERGAFAAGEASFPVWVPSKERRAEFTLRIPWPAGSHVLAFSADAGGAVKESCEANNRVEEETGALALAVIVSETEHRSHIDRENPDGSRGFEGWVRLLVGRMHDGFRRSVHPSAPEGAQERVRIDALLVMGDPAARNRLRASGAALGFDAVWEYPEGLALPLGEDGNDLGAARAIALRLGVLDPSVLRIEPWANRARSPSGAPWQAGFETAGAGLLDDPPGSALLPEHAVLSLNRQRGRRRGFGADCVLDVPRALAFSVTDASGKPVEGAVLRFFQSRGSAVPESPDPEGRTDRQGKWTLPPRPVEPFSTDAGFALRDNPFGTLAMDGGNGVFFVEIGGRGHVEHRWLPVTAANLAQWKGQAEIAWATRIPPLKALPAPAWARARAFSAEAGESVELRWAPVEGAQGYRVLRAESPGFEFREAASAGAATCTTRASRCSF
jgi:hypothetical protein